jgi:hypothetical protein
MAGEDDWWKSAPVVSSGGNWWDAAPVVDAKAARDNEAMKARIAAAKAGTLKISPERAGRQAYIDATTEQRMNDTGFGAFMSGAGKGASFGFADEIAAGIGSLFEDRSYDDILAGLRARDAGLREDFPKSSIGGEITGAVASPINKAILPVAGPSLAVNALRGAASGAAGGALYGFGSGEGGFENRLASGGIGALGGAFIGGAIPALGQVARAGLNKLADTRATKAAMAAAPSLDDLKAAASRIYAQADNTPGMPRADFAAQAVGTLDDAARAGMDDMLTPGAARVAGKIDDAAASADPTIGFRELDILRKQAGVPAGNVTNRTEAAIGSKFIGAIDDFIDNADPQLSGALREARNMWGQLRRSELIGAAMDKAKNTASGFENGLRIEFRKILNNPKLLRGFNEQEIAAIKSVVAGTPMGNLLRQVGRIGIGLSGQSNGLGASIGGIAGTAAGGPLGGIAAVGAGTVAKALAERTTRKAAERAFALTGARNALAGVQPQVYLPGIENALGIASQSALGPLAVPVGNVLLGR